MSKLAEFAEMILARNTVETMVEIVCSMSDEDVKKIMSA